MGYELSLEDANAIADAEAFGAGDFHFGSDMARVHIAEGII